MIDYCLQILAGCFVKNITREFGNIHTFLDQSPDDLDQQLGVGDVKKPAVVQREYRIPLLNLLRQNMSTMKIPCNLYEKLE